MTAQKGTDAGPGRAPRARTDSTPAPITPALRRWFIALALLTVVPWLVVAALSWPRPQAPASPAVPDIGAVATARPGPWGKLALVPLVVSPPIEYVSIDGPSSEGVWFLPGATPEAATAFFAAAGLTPDDVARLQATMRPEPRIRGLTVTPPPSMVRAWSPEVRSRIYDQLARTRLNDQARAFRYEAATAEDWLRGNVIAPETRAKVEPLLYRAGASLYFADLRLIRDELDPRELQRLVKVLNRRRTYVVKLSVADSTEAEAAAEYWGVRGRRTDVRAMLESITAGRSDQGLDIVHLLPSLGRDYLYRFPRVTAADLDRPVIANCLWTALNFFNLVPDDRFLDVDHALEVLKHDYYVVQNTFRLGDIIAFLDEDDNIFHAAVYLADDLAFTKNGTTPMAPWAIMKIDEIKEVYRTRSNIRLIVHRNQAF